MSRHPGGLAQARQLIRMSADLVAVIALVVITDLLALRPVGAEPLVRAVLGLTFVLFVPGYALVSALFPEADRSSIAGETDEPAEAADRFFPIYRDGMARGIDGVERVALAFALSVALVPLVMVGVTVSPLEFTTVSVFLTISAVTVACAVVAAVRRWSLPDDQRFRVPYGATIEMGKGLVTGADSRFDAVLNIALVVAVVLAIGTLTLAVVAPQDGERYTEFYVLTEGGDGELVATDYPETFSPGEPELLHVGIENYEHEAVDYSVVVQLQRMDDDPVEPVITERVEVDRFAMTLPTNETSVRERELTVSDELTGNGLRLTFLLYDGSVPESPTRDNAYQSLHLWVDVEVVVE